MRKDAGIALSSLKVDGGAAANNLLMQFQAELLNSEVVRPKFLETTFRCCISCWSGCGRLARSSNVNSALAAGPYLHPVIE